MSSSSEDDSSLGGLRTPKRQSDVPEMPAAESPAWRLLRRPIQAVHHPDDAVDDEESWHAGVVPFG